MNKSARSHPPEGEDLCAPTPEQEEGPYYRDLLLDRADIREGRLGTPLRLDIGVVDSDCNPLAGAVVEVWQCDALGTYSWYAAAGDDDHDSRALLEPGTFLRGSQRLDEGGSCRFQTIYPGWYTGRAIHVHFKLRHPDGTLTGQLYFPDELTDAIHEREPYRSRPRRDTTNEEDVIYREGGAATLLHPQAEAGRYSANVRLAIERLDHEPTH